MTKFYDNINNNQLLELLMATPYAKTTDVNFVTSLNKDLFFNSLYTESSKSVENDLFDKKVEHALIGIDNRFAKVSMIHIAGYAGTGKTTYIHHLLWTRSHSIGRYDVIDFEGYKRAVAPFRDRLAHLMFSYGKLNDLIGYFDCVTRYELYNVERFREQLPLLKAFNERIKQRDNKTITESEIVKCLLVFEEELMENCTESERSTKEKEYLSFLLFLEFMLLLYDRFYTREKSPMILVMDNTDSLHNLSQEMILLPTLKAFVNDCNYFFAFNLISDAKYKNIKISEVCNNTKLVIFFTTRVVTINHYEIVEPDWEKINGWTSLELPEHYYDHKAVINNRIDYYLDQEKQTGSSETLELLKDIKKLTEIAYRNYTFQRLFNGNMRVCLEMAVKIIEDYPSQLLSDLYDLHSSNAEGTVEGANGYFLSMVLYELKKDGLYSKKLELSRCIPDGKVSLSRIILTILREKGDRCSMLDLFQLLTPVGYTENEICNTVWNLCETLREKWRRLIIFDLIIPADPHELKNQGNLFKNGDETISHYSEIVICTAGQAYMEYVVPHFEFMLSRHEEGIDAIEKLKYQPLFSTTSEQKFIGRDGKKHYRFEQKIDCVYKVVKDCCSNSVIFAGKVMHAFHMTRGEYINSYFNYHSQGWDGEVGPKQSYESRLIFRHIGYIERYRWYILDKYRKSNPDSMRTINNILVDKIIRYIKLYQYSHKCFQTEPQNRAAEELLNYANIIKNNDYYDFTTRIETPD